MDPQQTPRLPDERASISKASVDAIERDILQRRHIERYMAISQYAHGTVLDCAAGSGFGSYILAKKSDVKHVHGIDANHQAMETARQEFGSDKVTFHTAPIEAVSIAADFLVSIETIEHLSDPTTLADLCDRCGINEAVISFPSKKSTHYNKFHKWDLVPQDIADIFQHFMIINTQTFAQDTCIVRLVRHDREVIAPRRWNRIGGHE
jgi:cyclopropane fatty-acyl-phospholipid synthase-like methyltransferase